MSSEKFARYRQAQGPLPATHWLWPLYGAGLENLGREGRPIQVPMPVCGPDELLVRHDAVGLCFSDTKVIQVGGAHPRLRGRDLEREPVVLGHEVAMTIAQVGENLRDRFHVGERFIIQADIYYHGVGLAYGYALQGGLSQYNVVGPEILKGDEGCYLLPIKPHMGYAQAALTEPWACVVAAYHIAYRTAWKPGGRVLIVFGPKTPYIVRLGEPFDSAAPPAEVLVFQPEYEVWNSLRVRCAQRHVRLDRLSSLEDLAGQTFDDIVLVGGTPELYERLEPLAANGAMINLVGVAGFIGKTQVDVGRLHYDHIGLVGTYTPTISAGYEQPIRSEFRPGGCMLLLGAAGPMGQIHFQRALQAETSPRLVVAASRSMDRLGLLVPKYRDLIAAKEGQTRVLVRAFGERLTEAFCQELLAETGGQGFDDIIVLAPSAQVVADAMPLLAPQGVMNIFAGLPRGTKAAIDLYSIARHGVRLVGSSGSSIADLRHMLEEAESGRLDPNLSVVAISGLGDAKKGLEGVMSQRFPGKVVIYPQVLDFPLTMLPDLKERLPRVYERLGPNESWTVEAEAAFLEELLP